MTVFTSKGDSKANANTPLTKLRLLKSQAQTGERHRRLQREHESTRNKVENDGSESEPEGVNKTKKKRNFFKWLFQKDVPTNRKVSPPLQPKIRVKIPIVYRNGEHKGVVVGGLRVPFSRPMQVNRRSLLLHGNGVNCCIPEDIEMLLDFPDRLAAEEYNTEQQRQQQEKKKLKEEKLAQELAK